MLFRSEQGEANIIPKDLNICDPIHSIIFDNKFQFVPAKLQTEFPFKTPLKSLLKTEPPAVLKKDPLKGHTKESAQASLFYSIFSILSAYNSKVPESFSELRQKIVKQLRNTTPEFKIRDFHFNLNFGKYKQFLNDFLEGKVQIDPDLIMLDTFAHVLQRPIVVLSSLEKHADNKVQYFGTMQEDKPPIEIGRAHV